jgi:hypothetical protein
MKEKKDIKKFLAARIDRWMESGEPEVTLEYMLPVVNDDIKIVSEFLIEWRNEGKIEWILPLEQYSPNKPIVRFSHYITKHVPWQK